MKITIKLILVSLFFIGLSSCKKEIEEKTDIETICNVEAPLEDLVWLNEIKVAFEADGNVIGQGITHYMYNDNDVFFIQDCINCSDGWDYVLDCQGERLCDFGSIAGLNTCPDFFQDAIIVEVLYGE